ncbi:MAG: glycine cleavage system aminomethyltransferase GcvT, partial [Gemmatimonadetes bacterium]|nr:glycine cleavage system aminomethyltransferase GcvT [Gemmatimonadota bacterium]NIU74314.1 glycine cleavage system aminomethyltransferase GcvT [Gammaproteobacteria bacterium]NIP79402.1 glycine cleavage system aminomethyltransferase GcvT [Gemmatimonadota bacterium]NIQ54116.1 glycine cleavage system aminomethyltransferase GcvT [Gemmatimonadota bacterium]NIX44319.1 glycine cleavage system aminomethyltransferase GcvT [Gemmatimonadota bacterium]
MADETLKRTPLHDEHVALGGRMVPFAGYAMPVQYPAGIVKEHQAVRSAAGLFDVSHMGEFEVRGPEALDLIQHLLTNDASRLDVGQAQYTVLCQPDGTALDDCLVYRFDDHYMVVVNAANLEKDRAWFETAATDFDATFADRSEETALLALQGPKAQPILAGLTDTDLDAIGFYRFARGAVAGRDAVISRTGYTGEDGFELYLAAVDAVDVWRALLEAGEPQGLLPAGLGARDSLRLEVGYILYGNDLDERHTPLEAGLGWVVKLDKGDFVGRDALARQKEEGVREKLVGFVLKERGFPRQGYEIRVD